MSFKEPIVLTSPQHVAACCLTTKMCCKHRDCILCWQVLAFILVILVFILALMCTVIGFTDDIFWMKITGPTILGIYAISFIVFLIVLCVSRCKEMSEENQQTYINHTYL